MEWLGLGLLVVGALAWMLTRQKPRQQAGWQAPDSGDAAARVAEGAVEPKPAVERQRREAQAAADRHAAALVALLAVARADGSISKGETDELHDFLTRVGQRDHQATLIHAARTQYSGSPEHFAAAIRQTAVDPGYREAVLRSMELIIQRGNLAHPAELEMIRQAAAAWGLPVPTFSMPVGVPLRGARAVGGNQRG
jgi:uncharacterized membrane protein YebE (DUF533 family)